MSKCIGIVGSRRRDGIVNYSACCEALEKIYEVGDTLVSGGCEKGADRFAEVIAKNRGLTITIHYPDWKAEKKAAGFIRNTRIAEDCDILIALVAQDRKGGTENTIKKVRSMGKKVIVVEETDAS